MRGPPEKRRAALQGSPDRYCQPPEPTDNEYADAAIISTVSLDHVLETNAGHYRAVAPDGLLIGSYPSRFEAARAFSGVRP
jgi:hypothetical protein